MDKSLPFSILAEGWTFWSFTIQKWIRTHKFAFFCFSWGANIFILYNSDGHTNLPFSVWLRGENVRSLQFRNGHTSLPFSILAEGWECSSFTIQKWTHMFDFVSILAEVQECSSFTIQKWTQKVVVVFSILSEGSNQFVIYHFYGPT